nr:MULTISPECIES: class I SAM-dependent methyltransferase [Mycobacterium]
MLRPVDYNTRLHRGYDQGRRLSEQAARSWSAAVTRQLPPQRPVTIVELGAGTARFTQLLADIASGVVYAVEPSQRMREVAMQHYRSGVYFIAGRAEAIPLATESCDAAAIFFAVHHLADLHAGAREIARVLRPGGRLLIAGSFSDRLHPRAYYHYIPRAREIEENLFPNLATTTEAFGRAGVTVIALDEVGHEVSASLTAYSARLTHRAISTFEYLTDDEIDRGLAQLAADAAAETNPQPVHHTHDLLTLEKRCATRDVPIRRAAGKCLD